MYPFPITEYYLSESTLQPDHWKHQFLLCHPEVIRPLGRLGVLSGRLSLWRWGLRVCCFSQFHQLWSHQSFWCRNGPPINNIPSFLSPCPHPGSGIKELMPFFFSPAITYIQLSSHRKQQYSFWKGKMAPDRLSYWMSLPEQINMLSES